MPTTDPRQARHSSLPPDETNEGGSNPSLDLVWLLRDPLLPEGGMGVNHERMPRLVAWSPTQPYLAYVSRCAVTVWDIRSGILRAATALTREVHAVAWLQDGATLAFSIERELWTWEPFSSAGPKNVLELTAPALAMATSATGQRLACALSDASISIIRIAESVEIVTTLNGHYRVALALAWSPDSSKLASASTDGELRLWDLETTESVVTRGDRALGLTWHPSKPMLAIASSRARIDIVDADSLRTMRQLTGHTNEVHFVTFDAQGMLLVSASSDGTVRTWRADTWEALTLNSTASGAPIPYAGAAAQMLTGGVAWIDQQEGSVSVARLEADSLLRRVTLVKTVHYSSGRIVLVGASGTGKTCLAHVLLGLPFQPQASTHGITVYRFESETASRADGSRVIRETLLWDLAGQPEYQLVHQLFLDDSAVGVVVFDPTNPEAPFQTVQHWERALRRLGGKFCRKLLVAGRTDRGDPTVTKPEIAQFCDEHGFEHFVATSAAEGTGIHELRQRISELMPWEALPITSSPELWLTVRDYILSAANATPLVAADALYNSFSRDRPYVDVSRADFDAILAHAQSHGFVWRLSFGGFLLLRPALLNAYASAVIQSARRHEDGLGCVRERDIIERRLGIRDAVEGSAGQILLHAVIELFLEREIAFREGEWIVFPSRLNRNQPPLSACLRRALYFLFEGVPEQIYATLVVRLAHSQVFANPTLWRDGAEFAYGDGRCSFRLSAAGDGSAELSLYFTEEVPDFARRLFAHFVQEHLARRALPGTFSRQVVYQCGNCGWEVRDRELLDRKLAQGRTTLPCLDCEGAVSLKDPLVFDPHADNGLARKLRQMEVQADENREAEVNITTSAAKKALGEFDVFLAHNARDKALVLTIANELRRRGLAPWLDAEQVAPGRWFQDVIQSAIPKVKSAAIILGPNGIGRWEALELRTFISECIDRALPVIPVLLPGLAAIPEDMRFLRELNLVQFSSSLDEVAAYDRLQWGITQDRPAGTTPAV
jgi:small GTP-binding protein